MSDLNASLNRALEATMDFAMAPDEPPIDEVPIADVEPVDRAGGMDVLVRQGAKDVLLVGIGSMASTAVDVAERLSAQGIGVTVVDPRTAIAASWTNSRVSTDIEL